jgi:phthalate 4,5-dioxygenase oxygenase subunit
MIAKQQALLTHTGAGTPGGNLLRSYWQPIALAEELPLGGSPIPVDAFGEELVLYRDLRGEIGLLGRRCPHRRVDLCYGRVEHAGLRCIYHGWLFDNEGKLLEQPGVPVSAKQMVGRVQHNAYPCHEAGGVIFAYLGKGEPPLFPEYEFLNTMPAERLVLKVFHACNYLQGVEGNMDQVHVSFLHRMAPMPATQSHFDQKIGGSDVAPLQLLAHDTTPTIIPQRTSFGMREVVTRNAPEGTYVKVENFVLPGFSAVPGAVYARGGYQVNWHVPINDTSHWKYFILFRRGEEFDQVKAREMLIGTSPPFGADYKYQKPAGERHAQDRVAMQTGESFAGLGYGFAYHDMVICEAQGQIYDRTNEVLGPEDRSIAMVRRVMLDAINDMEAGRDPPHVVRAPRQAVFADLIVVADIIAVGKDAQQHVAELLEARGAGVCAEDTVAEPTS